MRKEWEEKRSLQACTQPVEKEGSTMGSQGE